MINREGGFVNIFLKLISGIFKDMVISELYRKKRFLKSTHIPEKSTDTEYEVMNRSGCRIKGKSGQYERTFRGEGVNEGESG